MLFIRPLDAIEARPVAGSEGAQRPFWSPDSKSVAWFRQNQLQRVDLAGGGAQRICAISGAGRGGTWNANGVILFADQSSSTHGIHRVSASGGEPTEETVLDPKRGENSHYYPQFLPDGQHFLYFRRGADEKATGTYIGTLGDAKKGMEDKLLLPSEFRAVYAAGYLLTLRADSLLAQPFDAANLMLKGEPKPVATGVTIAEPNNFFDASASLSGILAYGTAELGVEKGILRWHDRSGKTLATVGPSITASNLFLSPDAKRVAGVFQGSRAGIWILDFDRETRTRLTFQAPANSLAWSPDGREIAHLAGTVVQRRTLTVKPVNGAGSERVVPGAESIMLAGLSDWAHDGRFVVHGGVTAADIFALPPEGGKPDALVTGPTAQSNGRISPDGRWIAYVSAESGRGEIFISGISGAQGKWQVSTNGGATPHWRNDGKELIYRDVASQKLVAVPITPVPAGLTLGKPEELFRPVGVFNYDITADHQRFLVVEPPEGQQNAPFIILQNWQQLLK
jgi:Tol biopolymer transport system component